MATMINAVDELESLIVVTNGKLDIVISRLEAIIDILKDVKVKDRIRVVTT